MNENPFPANGPLELFGPDADFARANGLHHSPQRRVVRINNPQGLHMRPAAAFAQLARQFECTVAVSLNEKTVNGKSWLDLMLLAAEPNADVVVEVAGSDAEAALPALADLLAAEGSE